MLLEDAFINALLANSTFFFLSLHINLIIANKLLHQLQKLLFSEKRSLFYFFGKKTTLFDIFWLFLECADFFHARER